MKFAILITQLNRKTMVQKNNTDKRPQENEDMLKEKTNQDFNKQKPNPKDPNQVEGQPESEDVDEDVTKRKVNSNPENISDPSQTKEEGYEGSSRIFEEYDRKFSNFKNRMMRAVAEKTENALSKSIKNWDNEKREQEYDSMRVNNRAENHDFSQVRW